MGQSEPPPVCTSSATKNNFIRRRARGCLSGIIVKPCQRLLLKARTTSRSNPESEAFSEPAAAEGDKQETKKKKVKLAPIRQRTRIWLVDRKMDAAGAICEPKDKPKERATDHSQEGITAEQEPRPETQAAQEPHEDATSDEGPATNAAAAPSKSIQIVPGEEREGLEPFVERCTPCPATSDNTSVSDNTKLSTNSTVFDKSTSQPQFHFSSSSSGTENTTIPTTTQHTRRLTPTAEPADYWGKPKSRTPSPAEKKQRAKYEFSWDNYKSNYSNDSTNLKLQKQQEAVAPEKQALKEAWGDFSPPQAPASTTTTTTTPPPTKRKPTSSPDRTPEHSNKSKTRLDTKTDPDSAPTAPQHAQKSRGASPDNPPSSFSTLSSKNSSDNVLYNPEPPKPLTWVTPAAPKKEANNPDALRVEVIELPRARGTPADLVVAFSAPASFRVCSESDKLAAKYLMDDTPSNPYLKAEIAGRRMCHTSGWIARDRSAMHRELSAWRQRCKIQESEWESPFFRESEVVHDSTSRVRWRPRERNKWIGYVNWGRKGIGAMSREEADREVCRLNANGKGRLPW